MRSILVAVSLAALSGIALHGQAAARGQAAQTSPQAVTINGCMYRADDAATFLLERTSDADATGTQPSAARPGDQANVRGATGTSGTTTLSPGGAAGTGTTGPAPATWYRLGVGPTSNFGEFVGKAVRIRGTVSAASGTGAAPAGNSNQAGTRAVEPAQIPPGAPSGTDVKALPQLMVQEISAVEGQCRTSQAAPDAR